MAVNEQFLILMPTLDPGSMATGLKLYPSLDAMWKAFNDLAHNKTAAVNGQCFFFCVFLRRDRAIILLLCPSTIPLTIDLTIHPTAGH